VRQTDTPSPARDVHATLYEHAQELEHRRLQRVESEQAALSFSPQIDDRSRALAERARIVRWPWCVSEGQSH
jgi:hypothetical protein